MHYFSDWDSQIFASLLLCDPEMSTKVGTRFPIFLFIISVAFCAVTAIVLLMASPFTEHILCVGSFEK